MHIHPGSPNSSQSEESAATKIQAGFRGYRVRKQLKQNSISPSNQNRNNRSIGRNQIDKIMDSNKNSNNSASSSRLNGIHTLSSSSAPKTTISSSPTSITSKNNNNTINGSVEEKCAAKIQAGIRGYLVRKHQKREQEAATKIQASFRGFKVRKDLEKIKQK